MTQVIFLHSAGPQGSGEGSSGLLAGLKEALPPGMTLVAPLMPEPDNPSAERWIAASQRVLAGVNGPHILVGHSLGGSILLQALARHGAREGLRGVVLLNSPFWGAPGWGFQDFALTESDVRQLQDLPRLLILQGDVDDVVSSDHPERYKKLLPLAETQMLEGIDHEAAHAAPHVIAAIQKVCQMGK